MWVDGADGIPVHVFIVKPHGFEEYKKYPLIINVHGGPQMQWMDSYRGDWQIYPGSGYVVAFLNPMALPDTEANTPKQFQKIGEVKYMKM